MDTNLDHEAPHGHETPLYELALDNWYATSPGVTFETSAFLQELYERDYGPPSLWARGDRDEAIPDWRPEAEYEEIPLRDGLVYPADFETWMNVDGITLPVDMILGTNTPIFNALIDREIEDGGFSNDLVEHLLNVVYPAENLTETQFAWRFRRSENAHRIWHKA